MLTQRDARLTKAYCRAQDALAATSITWDTDIEDWSKLRHYPTALMVLPVPAPNEPATCSSDMLAVPILKRNRKVGNERTTLDFR